MRMESLCRCRITTTCSNRHECEASQRGAGRRMRTYGDASQASEPGGVYLIGWGARRKLAVVLVTVLCVTAGVFVALRPTDHYTASAEMLLTGGRESQQVGTPAGELSDRTIQSQIRVVTSAPVLELADVEAGPEHRRRSAQLLKQGRT